MIRIAAVDREASSSQTDSNELVKGLAAGIIGGLAGAWMMNQYHNLASTLQEGESSRDDHERGAQGGRQNARQNIGNEQETGAPATEKAATAVITGVLGRRMSKDQKQRAGSATHYAFGASAGGFYGILAEAAPIATSGMGLLYGAGVWLAADEIAVPALGLSKPPQQHAPSTHVNALLAHLVFGFTLEVVRRLIRRVL
jgi:putative membrane protein